MTVLLIMCLPFPRGACRWILRPGLGGVEEILGGLLRDPFPPVREDRVRARITYHDFEAGETLEPRPGVRVRTVALNHPQGATGFRVEHGGRSICYVTDTEHTPGARPSACIPMTRPIG